MTQLILINKSVFMLLVRTFGRFHICHRRALLHFWSKKKNILCIAPFLSFLDKSSY